MKTGNTYHTTATHIRLTDPEIRSILAAPLRHIRRRVKPTPPDGWCPVVGVYTSTVCPKVVPFDRFRARRI